MGLELLCMALIGLLFGLALVFVGYRLFLILLPIWGFFFGFGLGAQTIQVILGTEFLGTVTGWVVGFIVGAIFAILSYLFYVVAVAIISGSLGYGLAVALLGAIGLNLNFIVWILGIIVAVIVAGVVLYFNIQKYAIIVITALAGTGIIILSLVAPFVSARVLALLENPVRVILDRSFLWVLFYIVVAGLGIFMQIMSNREFEIETYNRVEEYT